MYKILIADDVNFNRKMIGDILKEKIDSVEILEASDGKEVMRILAAEPVDLILLDLIMPEMDGYETMRAIKSSHLWRDIPVIVNSAINDITSIKNLLADGAVDYFTKPLTEDEMDTILPLKVRNAMVLYEQRKTIERLHNHIQEELQSAHDFQTIMLPKSSQLHSVELAIKYVPSLGIGGDFFDCVETPSGVWFMIADITGHGIAAAMMSSMVKILFRKALDHPEQSPAELVAEINRNVGTYFEKGLANQHLMFTAFVGKMTEGRLSYCNAGHPTPVVIKCSGEGVIEASAGGPLIGVYPDGDYDQETLELAVGDGILLYTDGLFSVGQQADFTHWTLVEAFADANRDLFNRSLEDFLEKIFYYFHLYHKRHTNVDDFTDDVAVMALKFNETTKS